MKRGMTGIATSVVFIILAVIFMVIAAGFPVERSPGVTGSLYGSAFFPLITLSLLIGFCLIVVFRDAWRLWRNRGVVPPGESPGSEPESFTVEDATDASAGAGGAKFVAPAWKGPVRVVAVWALCLMFALAWDRTSFLVPSIVFVAVTGYVVGVRSVRGVVVLAALNGVIWFIFQHLLNIPLSL